MQAYTSLGQYVKTTKKGCHHISSLNCLASEVKSKMAAKMQKIVLMEVSPVPEQIGTKFWWLPQCFGGQAF